MTYCLSMLCREGIVFISDSRTSAGVDNITVQPKMRVDAKKGDRVICLMPRMRFPGVTEQPGNRFE